MKKQILVLGFLSAVVSGALIFPRESSAFWIFDKFFGEGEVKGEQTDKPKKSIRNMFMKATPTPTPTVEEVPEIDEELSEKAIEKASVERVISATQRKQMLAKLAAIRAKKAEVKKLQEAFKIWMKENRIDPSVIKSLEPSETKSKEQKRKEVPEQQTAQEQVAE